ncbi:MAG: hypothetical protein ACQETO_11900, partial [Pseudomonadota bacterium]
AEPCLLHSLGRLYVAAARKHKRGMTLGLFVHHGMIDLVAIEDGSVVGYRRLTGMINGQFREDRVPYMVDQVNALQKQLRSPIEQMVVYHFLMPEEGPLTEWPEQVSEYLNLPLVNIDGEQYTLTDVDGDERTVISHILPLIRRMSFHNSSAPRKNRWLAGTVAMMPVVAFVLFLANAGAFATYALTTIDNRDLEAEIVDLQSQIEDYSQRQAAELPAYGTYLQSVADIARTRELPDYATVLSEVSGIFDEDLEVTLDAVRLTYPGDDRYRRAVATRNGVASPSGEGVMIDLAGQISGDYDSVMDAVDRISRQLGGSGYLLIDSTIDSNGEASDFVMKLERGADED